MSKERRTHPRFPLILTVQYLDAQSGYGSGDRPYVVATGAGMTSTRDNVRIVRLGVGVLWH